MTYPLVQFVSAPTEGAEVRFDFNEDTWADEETWPEHDGFSLGAPSLEGDPDGVGVEYGFRELSFNLLINAPRQAALARQSALAREILRQTNWLRFQLDEFSRPVWFKTYRTAPGELSFEHVYTERASDLWGLGVSLVADPFAYGERVTLPTVTIANNPTAATNPMSYALPAIIGDAPAPLRAEVETDGGLMFYSPLVSVYASENQYAGPVRWPTTNLTAATDTSAETADANYVGGNYRSVSFATNANLIERLSGNPHGVGGTQPAGTYKVLVRLARSDTSSTFSVRLRQEVSIVTDDIVGETVTFGGEVSPSAGRAAWVDLGQFSWPHGIYKDEATLTAPQGVSIGFDAARTSGTGSLRVDDFLLIPIDGPGVVASGSLTTEWDFASEFTFIIDGEGEYVAAPVVGPRSLRGGFPKVCPGAFNFLHWVHQTSAESRHASVDASDSIATLTDLTLSYQPRWLWIGGE